MYPPTMRIVNYILDKCVVEKERDCLPSAKELLSLIDLEMPRLGNNAQLLQEGIPWLCRICGVGKYMEISGDRMVLILENKSAKQDHSGAGSLNMLSVIQNLEPPDYLTARFFICDNCGGVELFHFNDGQRPKGWLPTKK